MCSLPSDNFYIVMLCYVMLGLQMQLKMFREVVMERKITFEQRSLRRAEERTSRRLLSLEQIEGRRTRTTEPEH